MENLIDWLDVLERDTLEKMFGALHDIIKDEENPSNTKKKNKNNIKQAGLYDLYLKYIENPLKKCESIEDIEYYVDSDLYTHFFWKKSNTNLKKFLSIVRYRIWGDYQLKKHPYWQEYNQQISNKL